LYPRAPIHATFFRASVVIIGTGASASVAYPALAPAAMGRADVENGLELAHDALDLAEALHAVPEQRAAGARERAVHALEVPRPVLDIRGRRPEQPAAVFTLLNALSSTPASTGERDGNSFVMTGASPGGCLTIAMHAVGSSP
jgi:hypothetical protein